MKTINKKDYLEVKFFYCGKEVTTYVKVPYYMIENECKKVINYVFSKGAKKGIN